MPMVWWYVPIRNNPFSRIPATDGADYLQSIVGFSAVNSGAGTNGDVTFRGMFGSRIKILTDGSENLAHVLAVWIHQPLIFHQKVLIEITVIKGPQTVQYANTGSAATVLFERKPEQFGEGQNYRGTSQCFDGFIWSFGS